MLTELAALLDLLKAKGVMRFSGPGSLIGDKDPLAFRVLVEFGPPVAAPDATTPTSTEAKDDAKGEAMQADSDTCRCGHSLAEHTNGLCLHACDVEQCVPEEK